MAQSVCILPPAEDRERRLAIVADRNRALNQVQRAHIILFSADVRTSANPRSGAGRRDTLRRVSRACCATRRASPVEFGFRLRRRQGYELSGLLRPSYTTGWDTTNVQLDRTALNGCQ